MNPDGTLDLSQFGPNNRAPSDVFVVNPDGTVDTRFPPQFAEGGIATAATFGMFGERGAEALIPLDQIADFSSMFQKLPLGGFPESPTSSNLRNDLVFNPASPTSESASGGDVNITIDIRDSTFKGPEEVKEEVVAAVMEAIKEGGFRGVARLIE